MKPLLLAVLLIAVAGVHAEDDDWPADLRKDQVQAEQLVRDAKAPGLTPEAAAEIERRRRAAVKKIETIADKRPGNTGAQLAVGRSLAAVEEAPRAVPYAERGLKLAEASGDQKLIRTALLAGAEIHYKAGNYELARERARRILRSDPRDRDALALYMQAKGRGAASAAAPVGGAAGSGSGSTGSNAVGGAGAAPETARGPGAAMTSAGSIEARKRIALGWSRIKLDAAAALGHFDAAVAADPGSAAVRAQRSKARLEAGDAPGALADADFAAALDPRLGEAYAARAEAKRALGRAQADLLADYETAARLDGRFADAYKSALLRGGGESAVDGDGAAGKAGSGGASAPDGPRGLLSRSPKGWGLPALSAALAAVLGGVIAPLALKRRRSGEDGSPPR